MIAAKPVRELTLSRPAQAGRPSYLSAASGLVADASAFYVVADDEAAIAAFDWGTAPGTCLPLPHPALPLEHAARKRAKPDWESLLALPGDFAAAGLPMLAIPSGSTDRRREGALVVVEGHRLVSVQTVDFGPLFLSLENELPELNLEGALFSAQQVLLFQRGNGPSNRNALAILDRERFLAHLRGREPVSPACLLEIRDVALGHLRGIPLSFTDACATADGAILFVAAAEASPNTYDDGVCSGSVLGRLDLSGRLEWIREIMVPMKAEGLALRENRLYVVTDADDLSRAAQLFELEIDLEEVAR